MSTESSSAGSRSAPPDAFRALAAELKRAFRGWERTSAPWSEDRLDEWARKAFRLQVAHDRPFRLFCRSRGVGPRDIRGWRDVPPVPTAAFREVDLCVGDAGAAELVFRTSGTTRGRARRGRHPVPDAEIYRASLEATFRRLVLRNGAPVRIGSLVPPFSPARDSSLSWMAEALVRRFGAPGSGFLSGPAGLRWDEAEDFVRTARDEGTPVLLLATTLALDEWVRRLRRRDRRLPLPAGSLLVDTGGTKGRPGLERGRVLEGVARRLGASAGRVVRVVNEFGMTELLSQRYSRPAALGSQGVGSPPSGEGASASASGLHGPPWLRTRVLDPVTLEELPEGEVGILCHFDLANLGSVCAVLTEDLGRVRGEALELLGRAEGAPPRGCSLATAELLAAQEDGEAGARDARHPGAGDAGPGEGLRGPS